MVAECPAIFEWSYNSISRVDTQVLKIGETPSDEVEGSRNMFVDLSMSVVNLQHVNLPSLI